MCEVMYCPNCGSRATGSFCANCGRPVAEVSDAPSMPYSDMTNSDSDMTGQDLVSQTTRTASQAAGTAIKGKILAGFIFAAIVAAGIFLYNMYFLAKPIDTVEKFLHGVNQADINIMISSLDPRAEKAYKAVDGIASNFLFGIHISDVIDILPLAYMLGKEASGDMSGIKIYIEEVISEDRDGDRATLDILFKVVKADAAGQQTIERGRDTITLQKFNEGWRIVQVSGQSVF